MADTSTLGIDVTELFLEDGGPADAAPDGDGLVWKTVCRTGQWRMSPIPGGKPLVIDHKLFRDVKQAFDDGAWEHVTVPLSHKDRVDENTGYVKALKVEPDPNRRGEHILRAGMRFTDPTIREKVTNGSIANTSVGIALTGHTRTSDGKHYPRVLKHVALTNQPWLDGLEPFGGELAASHDGALAYELDTTIIHPVVSAAPAWSNGEDYRQVQRGVERALSLYRVRDGGVVGPGDGIPDVYDPDGDGDDDSGEATDSDVPMEPLNDLGVIGLTAQNALVVPYAETEPGQMNQQGWVVPYTSGGDGVEIAHPDRWRAVSQQWMAASLDEDDQMLLAEWDPAKHPRWPKGTPAVGGRFMRIGDVLGQIEKAGGKLDVSWLAKGADNISHVEATRGGKDTAHFDVTLKDGTKHTFDVTEGGLRDGSLVQGALRQIDQTEPPRTYGHGDFRVGQKRPTIDPVLEHILAEAEADPTMHPPVKKGRTTRTLLDQEKPGGRPVPAGGHGNTQQMWTTGGEILPRTGEVVGGTWSHERKPLHDEIVNYFLNHRTPGTKGKGKPVALFFAGGTASGKSTALKGNPDVQPPDAVTIDPDEIKKWLPEFRDAALARDKYGSSMVHEESSAIAKRLLTEAQSAGHNVIIDGTGDSGQGKFEQKLTAADKIGYEVHVFMVDAPTDIAVARSIMRGQKTGRFVPTEITRDTHSNVSARHAEWRTNPIVKSWQLYSTDTPKGGPRAILMADGGDGKYAVHDAERYGAMLAKAGRRAEDRGGEPVGQVMGRRGDDAVPSDRTVTRVEGGATVQRFRGGGGRVTTADGQSYYKGSDAGQWQRESGGGHRSLDRQSASAGELDKLLGQGAEPKAAAPKAAKAANAADRTVLKIAPNAPAGGFQRQSVKLGDGTEVQRFSSGGGRVVLPNGESYYREKGDGEWQREVGDHGARSLDRNDPSTAELERLVAQGKPPDADAAARRRSAAALKAVDYETSRGRGEMISPSDLAKANGEGSGPHVLVQKGGERRFPSQRQAKAVGNVEGGKLYREQGGKRLFVQATVGKHERTPDNRGAVQKKADRQLADQSHRQAKAAVRGAGATRTTASEYLRQIVNFGGEPTAVGDVIRQLEEEGMDRRRIELYVAGLLHAKAKQPEQLHLPGIAASVRIENPPDELVLASWDSALHPRGMKGRFVRKLLDAAGNGMVKDVGESGSVLRVGLHTGHVLHVEPITPTRVRVIHSFEGRHVRTSVHAMAELTRDHPELRGLEGLIRSKARRATGGSHSIRRFAVNRGIKTLIHHGEAVHASQSGGGDNQMADENNEGQEGETLTLTRDEFQEAVHAAVETERERDRLELSRRGAEVREMRVERRIAQLQAAGHAPALLKVVEQIMLADETGEPVLTLSQDDEERPLTATMLVEELLAAMPETALTASNPSPAARAEGDGGEQEEDDDAFDKRMGETWDSMHKDGRHLVG